MAFLRRTAKLLVKQEVGLSILMFSLLFGIIRGTPLHPVRADLVRHPPRQPAAAGVFLPEASGPGAGRF
jgi:hypothetical protein